MKNARTTELQAINRLVNAICDVNSTKKSYNYVKILIALKEQILAKNKTFEDAKKIYDELIPYLCSKTRKELVSSLRTDEDKRGISQNNKNKEYVGYLHKEYLVDISTKAVTGNRGNAASTYYDLLVRVKDILANSVVDSAGAFIELESDKQLTLSEKKAS